MIRVHFFNRNAYIGVGGGAMPPGVCDKKGVGGGRERGEGTLERGKKEG